MRMTQDAKEDRKRMMKTSKQVAGCSTARVAKLRGNFGLGRRRQSIEAWIDLDNAKVQREEARVFLRGHSFSAVRHFTIPTALVRRKDSSGSRDNVTPEIFQKEISK